jgi:hypothetical protein
MSDKIINVKFKTTQSKKSKINIQEGASLHLNKIVNPHLLELINKCLANYKNEEAIITAAIDTQILGIVGEQNYIDIHSFIDKSLDETDYKLFFSSTIIYLITIIVKQLAFPDKLFNNNRCVC